MQYTWRIGGIYPVDAQTAGDVLETIYSETGSVTAAEVLDRSRPEDAPLHGCFEWDDTAAAEKYRTEQAKGIIRCLRVEVEADPGAEPVKVRAFTSIAPAYQPTAVVLHRPDWTEEMLTNARRDMRAFVDKYRTLSALAPILDEMERLLAEPTVRRPVQTNYSNISI